MIRNLLPHCTLNPATALHDTYYVRLGKNTNFYRLIYDRKNKYLQVRTENSVVTFKV
jgi:hypothetical protein